MALTDHRDIRSAALPFKRDKDHHEKWSHGTAPGPGVRRSIAGEFISGNGCQKVKVRPMKAFAYVLHLIPYRASADQTPNSSEPKSHANKATKPFSKHEQGVSSNKIDARHINKTDAIIDANNHTSSDLSKSLLDLIPQHANNTQSPIQIAIRESAADSEIFYSFDNKGPSPSHKGRDIDLGGLVDIAEQKWANEQVDRIVKGEYEVLDIKGDPTVISTKGKGKRSPKQKATKTAPAIPKSPEFEEDDGFMLV